MTQQPFGQERSEQRFSEALMALSARKQISLLIRATHSLSGHDNREVWRVAGFAVLRDRFLPILLHLLLKRMLAGTLWWLLCGVAVVLLLFVLALVEQTNSQAVVPALATMVSFFAGFVLFALMDFLRSLVKFFRTTCARSIRKELLTQLNACAYPEKLALLRLMSASLASKVPGESLLASLLMGVIFFLAAALSTGLVVLLTGLLPALSSFPWLLLVAGVAFLSGLLGPGTVQHRLLFRNTH